MANDVMNVRILGRRVYPELSRWALNAITSVLITKRQRDVGLIEKATCRRRQTLEKCSHNPRKAKECRQLVEARRGKEWILSQSLWRETNLRHTFDFRPLASKNVRK